MPWLTAEEARDWADDHGYYHYTCRNCGQSGWTDTVPDCGCRDHETEEDEGE